MKGFVLKKWGWFLSTSAFILFSCSNKAEVKYSQFSEVDSLEITMPREHIALTYWTNYREKDKTILVEYGLDSWGDLVVHQVDFEKKRYLDPIIITRDGPNGFNSSIASVFVKNRDSLYVFPAARPSFFLYNAQGIIINEYPYNSSDFNRYFNNNFYTSLIPLKDALVMTTINDTRYDDHNYFEKISPIQIYDIDSRNFSERIDYPAFTHGKFTPSNISNPMISSMDENTIIINYSFSDSVYLYDFNTKKTQGLYCGSDGFGKPKLLSRVPGKFEEVEYQVKEVEYELSFHRQGKIYRIASHLLQDRYRDYSIPEILNRNLRGVSLIELDLASNSSKFYEMPITKYFTFNDNQLIVGPISDREDGAETLRKFYIYSLN